MAQTGDDCYFYYYSTCAKGVSCPFRHQPAALGCEVTCNLWENGRCIKKACTFRHMVIEKNRSTIPCLWESKPSGCMKTHCSFLHTKPRNIPTTGPPSQPAFNQPPNNTTSTGQSIPTLSGNPRTTNPHVRPMHPQGPPGVGRAGMRPHMYNGPPRLNMPPNRGPYMGGPRPMQQRPMGYEGFIGHSQPSHPMMYHMHQNNQLHMAPMAYAGVLPGIIPNMMMNNQRGDYHRTTGSDYNDSDDDYTSSDFSDVSISDDERKVRPRESSRRRVQSPRYVKNRREVRPRDDRVKRTESRSTREAHTDRKTSRRKYEDKEKERTKKDSDRSKAKPRKHGEDKDSSSEKKRSESPIDKTKPEPDEPKGDIKVKTLEEILREKALKNLHERTAQKKKAQMDAEKARKEEGSDSDSPEPILKSVVSVNKAESTSSHKESQEPHNDDNDDDDSRDDDDNKEVQFIRETKVQLRSPKTIIRSIIDPNNEADNTSVPASKTFRKIKVESNEAKTENVSENKEEKSEDKTTGESTTKLYTSVLSNIKIKTFEEIMEEKRQRKVQGQQQSDDREQNIAETSSEITPSIQDISTTASDVKTVKTRKIRVIKKTTENVCKDTTDQSGGQITVRRKVETAPIKGIISKEVPSPVVQDEKTKENKNNTENQKDKPNHIVIKSFDEIMREKRQRRQEQPDQSQPSQESTASTTVKKTTIIRKKPVITKPEQKPVAPKAFKSRKLKVVGRQGLSIKSKEADREPSKPAPSNVQTIAESSSNQDTAHYFNTEKDTTQGFTQKYTSSMNVTDDSDDDDSWEHEELPAVPSETPYIPNETLKPAAAFHIPGTMAQANSRVKQSRVSPTKRPRSSLEELFGVPCDEPGSKEDKEVLSEEEEEKDVSPAKKVKTYNEINNEMAKKDDFDLELEAEIANLSPDKHFDSHDTLNEDDLLLELEEMIND